MGGYEVITKYINILKLNDWDIDVIEEPTLESEAMTKTIYNDYKAIIKIKKELSEVEKEKALIHELLHLVFRDAYDIFAEQCENEEIKTYCCRQHERAIEKTAKIIYKLANGTNCNGG